MKTINPIRNLPNHSSWRRALRLIPLGFVAFLAILPKAQAVSPAPDGGYPGGNTAEGQTALFSLTTGGFNTAIGWLSLRSNSTGSFNTAIGAGTLLANTADNNTAVGAGALLSNTSGLGNTANGAFTLFSNTEGNVNTATGDQALFSNTTGIGNTANGSRALFANTTGDTNTADGDGALLNNTIGFQNTAVGAGALFANTTGEHNTAAGIAALFHNTTGSENIALGFNAGTNVTTASNVICVGADGNNVDNSCYIGNIQNQAVGSALNPHFVFIDDNGKLGTMTADARGNTMAVPGPLRAQAQAMLNELQKEQKRITELEDTVARLAATVKGQAAQIQKVSVRLEPGKPAPQMVDNSR